MDQLNKSSITLLNRHHTQIISISQQHSPIEACGIIAGEDLISRKIYEITNSLNSPMEFLMDPAEMVEAFWDMEIHNWEPIAFFHSHPVSPPFPSQTDLKRNYYPDTPHLIAGQQGGNWVIRAFFLFKTNFQEIRIELI